MKKKLSEVCKFQYGYPFDSSLFSDTDGTPVIRIRDIIRGFSETRTTETCSRDYIVNNGDILIGMDGEFNIAKWKGGKAFLNQRVCKLIPFDVNKDYIFYHLPQILKSIEEKTSFVTVKHLSAKQLNSIYIDIPEQNIQYRIANIFIKIDSIINKRKQQLSKFDQLVKSRFIEMFGDPVENPHHWTISRLEHSIKFITSGSRGWSQYFSNDGELFITIKNVKNSKIIFNEVQYIHPPKNAEAARTKVQEDDLLISITADLGRTGVVTKFIAEKGAYINQHLTCIRLDKSKLLPLFVSYFLESPAGKKQFSQKNQTGVKAGLNFDAIKSLHIFTPPLSLQEQFIAFVQQVEKAKSSVKQSLEKLETLKKALMQEYFG